VGELSNDGDKNAASSSSSSELRSSREMRVALVSRPVSCDVTSRQRDDKTASSDAADTHTERDRERERLAS